MKNPNVRTQFAEFTKPTIDCSEDPGKTQQSFKEDADINVIVKKFTQTGIIDNLAKQQPSYRDNSDLTFTEAMYAVKDAETEFKKLPSEVRTHFENDAAQYLDAITDPERIAELSDLGLIEKAVETATEATATETISEETPKSVDEGN